MTTILRMLFALALAGLASASPAASGSRAEPSAPVPAARLAELNWLVGRWEGAGIDGGIATESYSPPAGGQIVGHFRQLKPDGSVMFYEIMTIAELGGTLHYRLKHFNPDLTGWEDKDRVVSFPLTDVTRGAWVFNGLAFRRDGTDGIVVTVRVREAGDERELVFRYKLVLADKRG